MDDIIQRMAGYIYKLDIDEDICKKTKCRLKLYETDAEECVDCIVDFFSNKCKWEHDEFCVNDKSQWVADFAYPSRCGRCDLCEPINTKDNGIEKVMEIIKVFHAHKKLYVRMRMKGGLYEKSK